VGEEPQSEFVQGRRLPLGLVADPAQRSCVELCSLCWIAAAQTDRPCAEYAPTFLAAAIMKAVFAQVTTVIGDGGGARARIREKALGTAVGAVAAVVVAVVALPPWAQTAIAVAALVLAVMQRATYWRMYGLITFSLVLFLASPGDVAFEAEERGFQILAGIALLILGLAVPRIINDWGAKSHTGPDRPAPPIQHDPRAAKKVTEQPALPVPASPPARSAAGGECLALRLRQRATSE